MQQSTVGNTKQIGLFNVLQNTFANSKSHIQDYNIMGQYSHQLTKPGAMLMLTLGSSGKGNTQKRNEQNEIEQNNTNTNIHNLTNSRLYTQNYTSSALLAYPLSKKIRLDINTNINYSLSNTGQQVEQIGLNNTKVIVDSLNRNFDYNILETPLLVRLNYLHKNLELKVGTRFLNYYLTGSINEMQNLVSRNDFGINPSVEFGINATKKFRFSVLYNQLLQIPSFDQVLPITNVSNPLNIIIGNPNLKSSLVHRAEFILSYNNMPSNINLSLRSIANFSNNKITTSYYIDYDPFVGMRRTFTFANVNGDYSLNNYYSFSKRIKKYNIKLSGSVNYYNNVFLDNSIKNTGKMLNISKQLLLDATAVKWLDISPNVKIDFNNTNFSSTNFLNIRSSTTELNIYGKAYITKLWIFGFDISKSYISGIDANVSQNPFILNFNIEKRLFKKKDAILSFLVMDALKQNNFVSRGMLPNGFVDSRSNINSRYFLLQFSWSPQQFTAGNNVGKARGRDGSFVN